ncbi:MAG: WbqC family protein [Cytophagaceae bacterium]|nr:WbqC family protein [Cytophagaceae bacterium]MDW8455342.1 WbqC family protein [Cytophagaceae bacterium]
MKLLIEPQYLPCLEYFHLLLNYSDVYLDGALRFQKQSYLNRTYILTSTQKLALIVPVKHPLNKPFKDIKIDYSLPWQKIHIRSIQSAYGKAPFFEFYFESIQNIISKRHDYLYDLNFELLNVCLNFVMNDVNKIVIHKGYTEVTTAIAKDIKDYRMSINAKKASQFKGVEYKQVFGRDFEPNLSIIDLLFCEGNNSLSYLV